jgi:alkanesulfonate monooxygenase SsuD/methylene tetrahydromethanopterin reductase-like flavin-dependent oxidoreductase (luciferase family)
MPSMKIDLLYELEIPRPWHERSEYEAYWNAIAQIELADRVGFGTVWVVEHHGTPEFSHSSAPEVFLSAVAQRTQRIRLGHGVVLLPHPFNHPIRVAERVATLDILSNGRVEFGTGRSGPYEQSRFGVAPEASRAMWDESLRIIPHLMMAEEYAFEGQFVRIPPVNVRPKPLQKPHPPLWLACTNPASWEIAGRYGLGALGLTVMTSVTEFSGFIRTYRAAQAAMTPVSPAVNRRVGTFTVVHCARDDATAVASGGGDAAIWYINQIMRRVLWVDQAYGVGGENSPYQHFLDRFPVLKRAEAGGLHVDEFDAQDMIIVGGPEKCLEKVRRYEAAGVDHLLCLMQAGRLRHEDILESIRLFGERIIPRVDPRL